jgi:hypothetical protein
MVNELRSWPLAAVLALSVATLACGDFNVVRPGDADEAVGDTYAWGASDAIPPGQVGVCVWAVDEDGNLGGLPADGYADFQVSATGGEIYNAPTGLFTHDFTYDCIEVWNATTANVETVTAELLALSSGYILDRIVVLGGVDYVGEVTGTNHASVEVFDQTGGYIWFKILPGEGDFPGGEGCTPGYWRQAHHFHNWVGYTPTTLFGDVFDDAFPGMTLHDVVQLGGGGLNALGRHTVAALLNAARVDFDYTAAQVIDLFNDVYPGSRGDYEALKNEFDFLNNQGCPL